MRPIREVTANALRGTTMLIQSHTARIILPMNIKGLAHALQNRTILLLISSLTVISVAMTTKSTPTVHATDTQTSVTCHKKQIENAITGSLIDKKVTVTALTHTVPTQQTALLTRRSTGINAYVHTTNVRRLIAIIALRGSNGPIPMDHVTHHIRSPLPESEKTAATCDLNNLRGTMNSSIMPQHANRGTAEGRKDTYHKPNRKGWRNHLR
jgi:hypothetical protein